MDLLKQVLTKIKPTKEEETRLNNIIKKILKRLNYTLSGQKAILGGSGVKDTWLRNQYDVDIFVLFDYKKFHNKSESLADILENQLVKVFPDRKRLHGSRDYFQIKSEGFTFEIIPILKIRKSSSAKNITDISPLHAVWVKKHKKYVDEIRLLKQFCNSANVYGAESYIKGFSGYICEVLTIYYRSFINVIKNAARWKEKVVIDIEGYYKGKDVLKTLNKSKTYSPIVIIDPVQHDRNAAAAISKEKFDIFRDTCKRFLKKPTMDFFIEKKINIEHIKKMAEKNKLLLLSAEPLDGKEDIVGCKLLRVFEYMTKKFEENDFKILRKGWHWDAPSKSIYYFIFRNSKISELKKHLGPHIKLAEHVKRFKKIHKKTFIKGKRICTYVRREVTLPEKLANKLILDNHIKDNVKNINIL